MAIRTLGHYICKDPVDQTPGDKAAMLADCLSAAATNRLDDVKRFAALLGDFRAGELAEALKCAVIRRDLPACLQLFQSLFGKPENESQRIMKVKLYAQGPIHASKGFANGLMQSIVIADRNEDWAAARALLQQAPRFGQPRGYLYGTLLHFAIENDRVNLFDQLFDEESQIAKYLKRDELLAAATNLYKRNGPNDTILWLLRFGEENQHYSDVERLGFQMLRAHQEKKATA